MTTTTAERVQLTPDAAQRAKELGIVGAPKATAQDLTTKIAKSRVAGLSDDDIVDYMARDPRYADKVTRSHAVGLSSADIVQAAAGNRTAFTMPQHERPWLFAIRSLGQDINDLLGQPGIDLPAGAVRGAANIGATLLAPVDAAARTLGFRNDWVGRDDRRASLDAFEDAVGVQRGSLPYTVGKLTSEIGGTAGIGGLLGKGVTAVGRTRIVPGAAREVAEGTKALADALRTSGFEVGKATGLTSAALRAVGGAVPSGAATYLVEGDADNVLEGAAIGAGLPLAAQGAAAALQGVRTFGRAAADPLREAAATRAAMRDGGLAVPRADKFGATEEVMRRNAERAPALVRKDLGFAADQPLTHKSLDAAIDDVYRNTIDPLKQAGDIPHGGTLRRTLDEVDRVIGGHGSKLPGNVRQDILALTQQYRLPVKQTVPADEVAHTVATLRRNASAAFDSGDAAMGRAQRAIADAWEATLEANLRARGPAGEALFDDYASAAPKVAKLYAVRKMVTPGIDTLDTRRLAEQLNAGVPLEDNLATLARADNLLHSLQHPPGGRAGSGTGAFLGGAAGAAVGGIPGGLLGAAAGPVMLRGARTIARNALIDDPARPLRGILRNTGPALLWTQQGADAQPVDASGVYGAPLGSGMYGLERGLFAR